MRYLIFRGPQSSLAQARAAFAALAQSPTAEHTVTAPSGASITAIVETPAPDQHPQSNPVDQNDTRLIWADGFPVHTAFDASDVREIDRRRDQLPALLGRFTVARLDKHTAELEIHTDAVGSAPAYLAQRADNGWAITNIAALAHRLAKRGDLDPSGAACMLCSPAPASNRTLITTVQVLRHASRTTATPDQPPRTEARDPLIDAGKPHPGLTTDQAAERFAAVFGPIFTRIAERGFDLRCGLTGGRDSRAIAALLASSVDNPRYHFGGATGAPESLLAERVANAMGGQFKLLSDPNNPITDNYDASERYLLERDCGMMEFSYLRPPPANPTNYYDPREVHLVGHAGEIARWSFESLTGLITAPSAKSSRHRLVNRICTTGSGLFSHEAAEITRDYINTHADTARDAGVTPTNIQTVVANQLKAPRWAALQLNRASERRDVICPFLTPPFFDVAMRLSPRDRFDDGFHKALIRRCAPAALAVPFHSYANTRQKLRNESIRNLMLVSKSLKALHTRRKPPGRHAKWEPWLRPVLQDRLLAHDKASPVWQYVQRDHLERLLTDDTGTPFRASIYPILAAATVIRFWELYTTEMAESIA